MQQRQHETQHYSQLRSIYLGGGTPSLLTTQELSLIFQHLDHIYTIPCDAEITLEANPEDMTDDHLACWLSLGINRLSIGVQATQNDQLDWMNRGHSFMQASKRIQNAQQCGFQNISVDYLIGLPFQTDILQDIQRLLSLNIQHISVYMLTVEKRTALYHQVQKNNIQLPNDGHIAAAFLAVHHALTQYGFEHYEISNYAKPHFRSKHNSSYWENQAYLGFGPSAHSFNGTNKRSKNVAHNLQYIKGILDNTPCLEHEILSHQQTYNEYIMLGMRTLQGVSAKTILAKWGDEVVKHFTTHIQYPIQQRWVHTEGDTYIPTLEGWLYVDTISSHLFLS